MAAITVTSLGKAYKLYPNRWARFAEWAIPFSKARHALKWVLSDLNFTINSGEAVGIVGINGAGKSTLLKLITGTSQPTTGSVHTNGRVAALLELGMGFHPDFTGRQNVFMACQLMGLHVDQINELMPAIESFAEIGDYIDQQVRVYSSGMQMRLAFSVATALRPDILIVDEALSVGDAFFQTKCYQRIIQFKEKGTTLLLVSHSVGDIVKHCERAILIKSGRIGQDGTSRLVTNLYLDELFGKPSGADPYEPPSAETVETEFLKGGEDTFHPTRLLPRRAPLGAWWRGHSGLSGYIQWRALSLAYRGKYYDRFLFQDSIRQRLRQHRSRLSG